MKTGDARTEYVEDGRVLHRTASIMSFWTIACVTLDVWLPLKLEPETITVHSNHARCRAGVIPDLVSASGQMQEAHRAAVHTGCDANPEWVLNADECRLLLTPIPFGFGSRLLGEFGAIRRYLCDISD